MTLVRSLFAALLMLGAFAAPAATFTLPDLQLPDLQLPEMRMPDFKRLERELRLKPYQKAQYDVATGSLKRTLLASASVLMEMRQQLADELVKAQPDFARVWKSQKAAFEMMSPLLRETLDEWSKLYALLEDDQVVIAKRFLRENLPQW